MAEGELRASVALEEIEQSRSGQPADQRRYLLVRAYLLKAPQQVGRAVPLAEGVVGDGAVSRSGDLLFGAGLLQAVQQAGNTIGVVQGDIVSTVGPVRGDLLFHPCSQLAV
jgi:hypothetical protein